MRSFIIFGLVVISVTLVGSTQAVAQSGSRSSGGGGGGGGARVSSGGGFSGRVSRPSRAQLQLQAQQEALLRAERAKQQFKQSLVQLGLPANSSQNSRQNRVAIQEAERDYKALLAKRIAPNQLGALQQPFRLTSEDISYSDHTANWPDALKSDDMSALVEGLDETIMGGGINSQQSAQKFLTQLQTLNIALNTSAVQGEVDGSDFAEARRFVTGLANEIRSSNLHN